MEYPFKDLLPLDEVLEREGYYKDWTHLDPEVFYSLTQISEYIKTKGFGVDVRLLIAQLAEHFGLRVTQITDAMVEFGDLKTKVEELIIQAEQSETTAELSLSRSTVALNRSQNALNVANGIDSKATNALSLSESADTLSKSVQDQFNQVVIDGDSSVEAAQARVDASGQTNPTLKARLDKEHNEVTTQLEQNEQQTRNKFHRQNVRPIVSFLDDDGGVPAYTKLKPIAEEYGIPFTLGIITTHTLFSEENRHMLHELVDDYGFEVASHSRNHIRLSELSYQEQEDEIRGSKQDLEEAGFDVHSFVYPFGQYNADTLDIVPKYYEGAYRTAPYGLNDSPIDTYRLRRIRFDPVNENNHLWWYKRQVDEAIRDKKWIVFMTHTDTRTEVGHWLEGEQIEMLKELIEYIQSKGVEITTVHEAFKRFENVYETLNGEYRIGVKSDVDEYVGDTDTNSKVPDWYTNDTTRITRLTFDYINSLTGADRFPINEASLLTTTRTDHFASQILHSRSGQTFFRTGIANTWSQWSSTDEYVDGKDVNDTNAKIPDWYPNHVTRKTRLTGAYMQSLTGPARFPTTEPSLLTTTRTDHFASQILHAMSGRTFFRTGIENQWSAWRSTDVEYVGETDTNSKVPNLYPNHSTRNTRFPGAYIRSLTGADKFPTDEPSLLTTTRTDDYASQTLHAMSGKTFFRTGIANNWSPWLKLSDDTGITKGVYENANNWEGIKLKFAALGKPDQPDNNYSVNITPHWDAGSVWISDLNTTGFKVNWSTSPTNGIKFGYQVIRG